jgi:hypothetical protein
MCPHPWGAQLSKAGFFDVSVGAVGRYGSLGVAYATRANATGREPRWTLGRVTIAAAPLSGLD